jgi:hypothetical protein
MALGPQRPDVEHVMRANPTESAGNAIILAASAALAIMRAMGVTHEAYQAVAHLWVGGLLALGLVKVAIAHNLASLMRLTAREWASRSFPLAMAVWLTLVEAYFFARGFLG